MAFFPFFFFFILLPSVHSLSTVAISETSDNQILICALTKKTSNQESFLTCSGFPSPVQIPGPSSNVSYSGIVAGDGFVCGLSDVTSSVSVLVCWRFSVNGSVTDYKRIYDDSAITQLESGSSRICGLNATGGLECWQWREFDPAPARKLNLSSIAVGDDFVCGLSGFGMVSCWGNFSVPDQIRDRNYSAIAAGFRYACGLTLDSGLHCWGDTDGQEIPNGKFKSLALGENRGCGLLANETVFCWGQNNFSLPETLRGSYFVDVKAKKNVFCGVLKSNFSLMCWGNQVFDSGFIVFEEVLPGPCKNVCPCGILANSARSCSQGSFICDHCYPNTITPPPASSPPALQPSPPPSSSSEGNSEWSGKMIAFLVVGCVGLSSLLLSISFFLFKYCKCRGCRVHDSGRLDDAGAAPEQQQMEQAQPVLEKRLSQLASMGNAGQLEEFSLQVLIQATNNFSQDHKVGTGSFGSVYLGVLEDGRELAIKRAELSTTSSYAVGTKRQEDKDNAFINELESLSRLHHKNLVRLLGFCEESNERVLIYEFMNNGTLHDHLHKIQNSPLMSWPARIKVALDASRGVEYLHEYAVPRIIHRDIKSSNILLDSTWTAKVSDFGLSLMGPDDEESHLSLHAAGTVGYMDPEYYRLQQLTAKSDVYSFGVMLLELLSGYKAIHKNENGVPRNVVDFVVPYIMQDEIHRVLDSRVAPPTPSEIEAVAYIGYLAADCVTREGRDRPSMSEIVNSLERALAACLVHPTSLSRSTTGSST
ncbi:serine/threonine-protein kinase-like protein CCR4 [Mercurialis annua]|uniref:serine/threonine-protein kinase-like protein CCR4 n=1 Tax=Mercurialis annua TaxID=3986 RepID=UPI00215FE9D5|nr:serine/threonine-protein kinase-like protein CCR4 [Mercurialis annua]